MNPETARALSDAIAKTRHPRLDYRTSEAQSYTARLRPLLSGRIHPGCRAFDLGCGAGKFTFEMERLGAQAIGLDCSEGAIRLAREIAQKMGSSAEFLVGTFESIPFPENSFDLVLFPKNIIECSYDEMDSIARQVRRILRSEGKFCLEMADGLERLQKTHGLGAGFETITGLRQTTIDVPDEGIYAYESAFWTVAFARFVVSRHLIFTRMEPVEGQSFFLEFIKQKDPESPA